MRKFSFRGSTLKATLAASAALIAALALAAPATAITRYDTGGDSSGPLDIKRMSLEQHVKTVAWRVHTDGDWSPAGLDGIPRPGHESARYMCLRIRRASGGAWRQLCFADGVGDSRFGFAIVRHDGTLDTLRWVPARVEKLGHGTFEARFHWKAADLHPGHYRWRSLSQWSGPVCPEPGGDRPHCHDIAPNGDPAKFQLYHLKPVGCRPTSPSVVYHGSRSQKRVALTFDDGPSSYTDNVLNILRNQHAKGTFFEIGDQVSGSPGVSRAVVNSGNEIANHSFHHELGPSYYSMAETSRRIEAATGFRPCLFRPPYGGYSSTTVSNARSLGMNTVIWDVDPQDWSTPGSDAIYQRVVANTQPGSIILMHDGGGDRSQTVAALPRIISTLRSRGYSFVTVTKLLGGKMVLDEAR